MTNLVPGGTGPIGANLTKTLLSKAHTIRRFVYPDDVGPANQLDDFAGAETVAA